MGLYRLTIRLHTVNDRDLIDALQQYPWGQRQALIRQVLRWYLVPGGFRDLVEALRTLPAPALPASEGTENPPAAPDPAPPYVPPPTVLGDPTDVPLTELLQGPQTAEEQRQLAQALDDMFKAFGGDGS